MLRHLTRLTSFGLVAAVVLGSFSSSWAQVTTNQITLRLLEPDPSCPTCPGKPMASAPVAVYLEPYDAGPSYAPVRVAQGQSDGDGNFVFSLSGNYSAQVEGAKTSGNEINASVIAINSVRTWKIDYELVLPVSANENYYEQIMAGIPQDPSGSQGVSTESFISSGTVTEDVPPAGFTCGGGSTTSTMSANTETSLSTDLDSSSEWDSSGGATAACLDESQEAGSAGGTMDRYVKVMNMHLTQAMAGTFYYRVGRGTRTEISYRICFPLSGGCGTAQVGGWRIERQERGDFTKLERTGPFHGTLRMEYRYRRHRKCVSYSYDASTFAQCEKMKRYWTPRFYTSGTSIADLDGPWPTRRSANDIALANGLTLGTEAHDNITYGSGVSIFGLGLNSEADYSRITELTWTGKPGCRKRWLYGKSSLPRSADEIFAESTGC